MSNYASKPLLNGLRFANNNPSAQYNTLPFDDKIDLNSYFQKWQRGDTCPIQLLFDFVPTLDIYTCDDYFVVNIPLTATTTGVIGQTFSVYEGAIDFSVLDEGVYYGKLTYEDENEILQDFRTSPLEVKDIHEGTSLFEYRNSRNNLGVIFDTGIVFKLRVETLFDEFLPKAKKQQYEDQKYNAMLLNGIPYRTFNVYFGPAPAIGESTFLPDWLVDKINLIFTCNEVRIDGTYYTSIDGAELKPTRPGNSYPNDGYWSLELQSIPNFDLSEYQTGDEPEGDIIVIKKAYSLPSVSASFAVNGVFTDNSNLVRVAVWNYGGDTFRMDFGTTALDDDIASFDILGSLDNPLDIGKLFNVATTVYVTFRNLAGTVITGLNLKVTFDYNQYDAPVLNPGSLGLEFRYPKGHCGQYYEVTDGDLETDWNLATGLGNVGTKYANCAIVGTNGIVDFTNKFIKVWNSSEVANFQATGGNTNGQVTLTRDVMPSEGIPMFGDSVGPSGQKPTASQTVAITGGSGVISYELLRTGSGGTQTPTLGLSGDLGSGDPLNIEPEFVYLLTFVALTD